MTKTQISLIAWAASILILIGSPCAGVFYAIQIRGYQLVSVRPLAVVLVVLFHVGLLMWVGLGIAYLRGRQRQ